MFSNPSYYFPRCPSFNDHILVAVMDRWRYVVAEVKVTQQQTMFYWAAISATKLVLA